MLITRVSYIHIVLKQEDKVEKRWKNSDNKLTFNVLIEKNLNRH